MISVYREISRYEPRGLDRTDRGSENGPRKTTDPASISPFGTRSLCFSPLSIPKRVSANLRNRWQVRQGNRALRDLDVSNRGEHGVQRGFAAVGGVVADWGVRSCSEGQRGRNCQAGSPESLSNFRSFLVFFRLSSSSHLIGSTAPLELHIWCQSTLPIFCCRRKAKREQLSGLWVWDHRPRAGG